MMKLFLLTSIQAIMAVGGIGLLTHVLHGRPAEFKEIMSGVFTLHGISGIILLFTSFVLLTIIVSFAKMSVYIPLNTALTFLVTIILTVVMGQERVTLYTALGMVLIVAGVALVSAKS